MLSTRSVRMSPHPVLEPGEVYHPIMITQTIFENTVAQVSLVNAVVQSKEDMVKDTAPLSCGRAFISPGW